MVAPGCRLYLLQVTAASFGDRLSCGFDHDFCWALYCLDLGVAESNICIEEQIMFLCDCKCALHLTQLSVSLLMSSTGSVVEWRRLFNGCRAFRRPRMLTLNIDFFHFEDFFAILVLIIFTTSALFKSAKTFHFSFQTWTWPLDIRVMFDKGCWWALMEFQKGCCAASFFQKRATYKNRPRTAKKLARQTCSKIVPLFFPDTHSRHEGQ